jgi:hypothetical protein
MAVATLIALLTVACGPDGRNDEIATRLVQAVSQAGDTGVVDLRPIFPEGADRMYAFPGYTSNDAIRDVVGDDWPAGDDEMVPYDGRVMLVWVSHDAVLGWAVLNGSRASVAVRFDSLRTPNPPEYQVSG